MNRNRLLAGIVILAILGITSVIGLVSLLNKWKTGQSQVGYKSPAMELTYCNSQNTTPCIVSFGIDSNGNMLVNLLVPASNFPDFYLKIIRNAGEHKYECQMVENLPTSFYCIGEKLPPGGTLQFMLVSSRDDSLLANGNLPLIGLAFPTLVMVLPTPSSTETLAPGQTPLAETPTPSQNTPKASTPTQSSYPNPTPVKNKTPSYP